MPEGKEKSASDILKGIADNLAFLGELVNLQSDIREIILDGGEAVLFYSDVLEDGPVLAVRSND